MAILKGFKFGAAEAAIKKPGRLDLGLIYSETVANAAAVFTTNNVKAAPVLLDEQRIKSGACRAILVNSGNANACTGSQGMEDAKKSSRQLGIILDIPEDDILVASTGVIGINLPIERVIDAIPKLCENLEQGTVEDVAKAMMTTDTFPKGEIRRGIANGKNYTICGIAKGSGMIMPNMATMLAFIMTDAAVEQEWLDQIFKTSINSSFNIITVDGDTSTNDTAIVMANGAAGNSLINDTHPDAEEFARLLEEVCIGLAKQMVKDGEGATKFVSITVKGALSDNDAKKAAFAIANSSLVKTAFFGQDANWGRILAAAGYSGAELKQELTELFFDDVQMAKNGIFIGGNAEAAGSEILKKDEFSVTLNLNLGHGKATVYTSDLSYDYVKINADYRT
ncbi:MAG: bifunctional glutamate N-acetyltransferase/amino-acid acetyltransferase ArgJ [Desulfuromonadales bacterium]|nr:bifunctional glutamate N-acetyltransferase/amino-acid acetyltransferase ArgJ [Desulfuromonadales bacterium]